MATLRREIPERGGGGVAAEQALRLCVSPRLISGLEPSGEQKLEV